VLGREILAEFQTAQTMAPAVHLPRPAVPRPAANVASGHYHDFRRPGESAARAARPSPPFAEAFVPRSRWVAGLMGDGLELQRCVAVCRPATWSLHFRTPT
jgi:hypothetical protein